MTLTGPRLLLRPGTDADAPRLAAIRAQPAVTRWWCAPEPADQIAAELRGEDGTVHFIAESGGEVIGLVQYSQEEDPDYRHAGIDIYLTTHVHGRGFGSEAVAVLARHLIDDLGHHRLTIDPAAANTSAIRCYTKVGFRPVGLMRRYERGSGGSWHDGLLMDLLATELNRDLLAQMPGAE